MLSVLADVGGLMAGGLEGAWFVVFVFLSAVWSVVYTLISTLFTSYVSFLTPLTSLKCPREIGSALNVIVSGQILSIQWFLIFQFKRITFFFYLFVVGMLCLFWPLLCLIGRPLSIGQLGASWIFGSQSDSNPNFFGETLLPEQSVEPWLWDIGLKVRQPISTVQLSHCLLS